MGALMAGCKVVIAIQTGRAASCGLALAVLFALGACDEPNPFYLGVPEAEGQDAADAKDAPLENPTPPDDAGDTKGPDSGGGNPPTCPPGDRIRLTCGLGVCANTVTSCVTTLDRADAPICEPKPAPRKDDGCGGGDEDCDGTIDEDCSTCVHVSQLGNDAKADGSRALPFRTLQVAIDWAAADPARPRQVCVAASLTCVPPKDEPTDFVAGEGKSLLLRDGISVVGGFESTTWTLCPPSADAPVPINAPTLVLRSVEGISFPPSVKSTTVFSGFRLAQAAPGRRGVAITVDGAKGAVVSHVAIAGGNKLDEAVGIEVKNGAEALITRSQVVGGEAQQLAVGVRVANATVQLVDNCASFDDKGRCRAACTAGAGIWGASRASAGARAFAVELIGAAAARVTNNALCAGPADQAAGLRLVGPSPDAVLAGNFVKSEDGRTLSAGLLFESCNEETPWVVSNPHVSAAPGAEQATVVGILARGACHPRFAANGFVGVTGGKAHSGFGVLCGADGEARSLCQVLDNAEIRGSQVSETLGSAGVVCEDGACALVAGNALIEGGRGAQSYGVVLAGGPTRLERNRIHGGCGKRAVGLAADDSQARVENNVIFGSHCPKDDEHTETANAVVVTVGARQHAPDLHSNTLDVSLGADECQGVTAVWQTAEGRSGATAGTVRNNIFSHHACEGPFFAEGDDKSRPRVFEFNLFHEDTGTVLYRAPGQALTLSQLNQSTGGAVRRNNDVGDPKFLSWPDNLGLDSGSAAIDKGTPEGAPRTDGANRPRDTKPDIGAFERE